MRSPSIPTIISLSLTHCSSHMRSPSIPTIFSLYTYHHFSLSYTLQFSLPLYLPSSLSLTHMRSPSIPTIFSFYTYHHFSLSYSYAFSLYLPSFLSLLLIAVLPLYLPSFLSLLLICVLPLYLPSSLPHSFFRDMGKRAGLEAIKYILGLYFYSKKRIFVSIIYGKNNARYLLTTGKGEKEIKSY